MQRFSTENTRMHDSKVEDLSVKRRTMLRNVTRLSAVDWISSLPDEVLSLIVDLLPTKEAVTTSILSRRWRHVYTWVTHLEFDLSPICHCSDPPQLQLMNCFTSFVDSVLHAYQSTKLTRFCLRIGNSDDILYRTYSINLKSSLLATWISFPLAYGIRELDLYVHVKQSRNPTKLPQEIFACRTLEVLKIDVNLGLKVSMLFCLPTLKVFHLRSVIITDGEFFTKLLSGCPSLEELVVRDCTADADDVINISTPTLIRLVIQINFVRTRTMQRYERMNEPLHNGILSRFVTIDEDLVVVSERFQRSDVVLHTPNLEYLEYDEDNLASRYFIGNMDALSEAVIYIITFSDHPESILDLVRPLYNVQHLTLDASVLSEDGVYNNLPVFHNLKHLKLILDNCYDHKALWGLLNCSPYLQRLTLGWGLGVEYDRGKDADDDEHREILEFICQHYNMHTTEGIPSCLSSCLKQVMIGKYNGFDTELEILKYFLKIALVLEELEVVCSKGVDAMLAEVAIKKLQRSSSNCSIKYRLEEPRS